MTHIKDLYSAEVILSDFVIQIINEIEWPIIYNDAPSQLMIHTHIHTQITKY